MLICCPKSWNMPHAKWRQVVEAPFPGQRSTAQCQYHNEAVGSRIAYPGNPKQPQIQKGTWHLHTQSIAVQCVAWLNAKSSGIRKVAMAEELKPLHPMWPFLGNQPSNEAWNHIGDLIHQSTRQATRQPNEQLINQPKSQRKPKSADKKPMYVLGIFWILVSTTSISSKKSASSRTKVTTSRSGTLISFSRSTRNPPANPVVL